MQTKFNIPFILFFTFTVAFVFVVLTLAMHQGPWYYLALLLALPSAFRCLTLHRDSVRKHLLGELRQNWGEKIPRDRKIDNLKKAYALFIAQSNPEDYLDDDTWNDLNMNPVYSDVDHTLTTPGEVFLYAILRHPEIEQSSLDERNRLIALFYSNAQVRESVQLKLQKINRGNPDEIANLLWGNLPTRSRFRWIFSIFACLPFCCLMFPLDSIPSVLLSILPFFGVNLLLTFYFRYFRSQSLYWLPSFRYMGRVIRHAQSLAAIAQPELGNELKTLKRLTHATRRIAKKTFFLNPEKGLSADVTELAYEYISILFLVEVRTFYALLEDIRAHLPELREMFCLIGKLDALQSVASFRASLPFFTEPELTQESVFLEMTEGCHPLLENPVPNSIKITSKGVVVNGSNMAGKSTFLRTVATNAILAQTVNTCYATQYKGAFFKILSSINHVDRLEEGKSHYLEEAERLLRIVRAVDVDTPCLCILDEPLMGTNSEERTSACVAVLNYVCAKKSIVLIATHDTALTSELCEQYDRCHFSECFSDEGLHFDFMLKQGATSKRNAIKLLDFLGFPKEIVNSANERLSRLPARESGKQASYLSDAVRV